MKELIERYTQALADEYAASTASKLAWSELAAAVVEAGPFRLGQRIIVKSGRHKSKTFQVVALAAVRRSYRDDDGFASRATIAPLKKDGTPSAVNHEWITEDRDGWQSDWEFAPEVQS